MIQQLLLDVRTPFAFISGYISKEARGRLLSLSRAEQVVNALNATTIGKLPSNLVWGYEPHEPRSTQDFDLTLGFNNVSHDGSFVPASCNVFINFTVRQTIVQALKSGIGRLEGIHFIDPNGTHLSNFRISSRCIVHALGLPPELWVATTIPAAVYATTPTGVHALTETSPVKRGWQAIARNFGDAPLLLAPRIARVVSAALRS